MEPIADARTVIVRPEAAATLAEGTAQADPAPGAGFGPFRIEGEIGRGGCGVVYRARQLDPPRPIALKVLRGSLGAGGEALDRFQREARILGGFKHDHLVRVFLAGQVDGSAYLAMEFVEGRSLMRRIADDGPIEPARAARLALQVARGLAYAHARAIVHRDVKPANVLLRTDADGEETAILTDFGLARDLEDPTLTRDGTLLGTPAYMAPEQAAGHGDEIDARTDVYGLGATLYEMLAGSVPFAGESTHALLSRIQTEDPVLPPGVPRDLRNVCLKMMARERERRYQSALEAAEDLERFLDGRAVRATPPSVLYLTTRFVARNRATSAAVAGAVLALAAFGAWSFREIDRRRREAEERAESEAREKARALVLLRREEEARVRDGDAMRLEELEREAGTLWPPRPGTIPVYEDWCRAARSLLERRSRHRAALELVPDLGTPEARRIADTRRRLVEGLDRLAASTLPDVEDRIRVGRSLAASLEESAAGWQDAIRSIADPTFCPAYRGLRIEPQAGLVPVGRDARSGLWEFACVGSGRIPSRDGAGDLAIGGDTAIVLVLLPGGPFAMGSNEQDAMEDEGPVHEIVLAPFFLAKHEMTLGQWTLAGGPEAGYYSGEGFRDEGVDPSSLPVDNVDWHDCGRTLRRLGLALPTEAQWEYAARAGTRTAWWTGPDAASVAGTMNLADRSFAVHPLGGTASVDAEDGHAYLAPAGATPPNPFGLHEVVGNVWEWCRDRYAPYDRPVRPGDGERDPEDPPSRYRVIRGGGFRAPAENARSGHRYFDVPEIVDEMGVRPARALDP